MKGWKYFIVMGVIALFFSGFCQPASAGQKIIFGGGPAGGTFQAVAECIENYKAIKSETDFSVEVEPTGGSTANLRQTDSGRQQMSVMYSGHVYLGRNGRLKYNTKKYENILAVAWLYSTPAQLLVQKNSGIRTVNDLKGKNVSVGNAGSGTFSNCEMFLSNAGLWNTINRKVMDSNEATMAFINHKIDAFFLFSPIPTQAAVVASKNSDIVLMDLDAAAESSGFYKKYPYFGRLTIPSDTYKGMTSDVHTFQDSAIWVANADVPSQVVYKMLSIIFSEDGLNYMRKQKEVFKNMSLRNGTNGIVTPFHPGAARFWQEKGVL